MKKDFKYILNLSIRYIVSVILAFPSFAVFYFIFTPATVYSLFYAINSFFDATMIFNTITIDGRFTISIIDACVAGPAYYLLFALNLSTPNIKIKKRIKMLVFSFGLLFAFNFLRIFLLSLMFINRSSFLDVSHKLFWYLGSTVFVVGIWFIEAKVFKIKEIPFYSDIKYLYKKTNFSK